MEISRPAWLEVNLDNLAHNIKTIKREIADNTEVLSIVKSDGYKFGAVQVVRKLIECGVNYFGVATTNEAINLRNHYKDINILLLGYTADYLFDQSIENNVIMGMSSIEQIRLLNEHAQKLGKVARVHVKVDSGMNRIGFKPTEESADEIVEASKLENINIEGIFTHFAVADTDEEYTMLQFNNFLKINELLKEKGLDIKFKHVSNSHATIKYREFDLSFVRPGVLQYGSTEEDPKGENFDVKFIGAIKAQIAHIKEIPEHTKISYGLTYETDANAKIATLPLGYADGIPRLLSNKIDVLVGGKRCPQVGRICMDQFMIDVTGVDCKIGDEVVIIGKQGEEEITIEEISEKAGEIPTSFVTHFNKRLPKVYIENNKVVEVYDLILKL